MRVDGPSTSVVGFSNYTQKIAADAVNPDNVAAGKAQQSSDQVRFQAQSVVSDSSMKNRDSFASDVVDIRADAIDYARKAESSNQSAEEVRSSFSAPAYEKGSIIDTMA